MSEAKRTPSPSPINTPSQFPQSSLDLQSLIRQGEEAFKESDASAQKVSTFNTNFVQYLNQQLNISFSDKFTKIFQKNQPFTTCYRVAYLHAIQAYDLAQQKEFQKGIEAYQKEIAILESIPQEILTKNPLYSLIKAHAIAKAYYEIGVLYTEWHRMVTEETEEDDQPIGSFNSNFLVKAQAAYKNGLSAYHKNLAEHGCKALPENYFNMKNADENLFDAFSQASFIGSRIAALFLNKGAVEETLANEALYLSDSKISDTSYKVNFKKAYEAVEKDLYANNLFKKHIIAQHNHFFPKHTEKTELEDEKVSRGIKKEYKKRKYTKKEKGENTGAHVDTQPMSSKEAIENFLSINIKEFAESMPESIKIRPHQIMHLENLQNKLRKNPNCFELGVISATGSGKTMVMKTFIHLLHENQEGTKCKLPIIIIVPTQSLVKQDAQKTSEYRDKGLDNLPNDEEIGKWYGGEKTLRPCTVITYQSLVKAANHSVKIYPTIEAFKNAIAQNPERIWTNPDLFFSPFNQSMIFFDEAHTAEAETFKATYARYLFPDQQELINRFFEQKKKRSDEKDTSTNSNPSSSSSAFVPERKKKKRSKIADIDDLFGDKEKFGKPHTFFYSTTATPSTYHTYYFPIDSEYTISNAIEDGISPPLQIFTIKLKDEALKEPLNRKLQQLSTGKNEFNTQQQKAINEFLLQNLGVFNKAFATILQSIDHKKSIVFVQTIEHVRVFEQHFKEAFEQENEEFIVTSMYGKGKTPQQNTKDEQKFRDADRGALINCQMVRLGSDFPDVDLIVEFRIFKNSVGAVVQAAGRGLRKKAEGETAKYIWLDLGVGQLNPAKAIFGSNYQNQNFQFPKKTSQEAIEASLIQAKDFPQNIDIEKPEGKSGDFFSLICPNREEIIYNYEGQGRVAEAAQTTHSQSSSKIRTLIRQSPQPQPSTSYSMLDAEMPPLQRLDSYQNLHTQQPSMPSGSSSLQISGLNPYTNTVLNEGGKKRERESEQEVIERDVDSGQQSSPSPHTMFGASAKKAKSTITVAPNEAKNDTNLLGDIPEMKKEEENEPDRIYPFMTVDQAKPIFSDLSNLDLTVDAEDFARFL